MLNFLQSDGPLAMGAIFALVMLVLRAASSEPLFRRDLFGAIVYLLAFFVLRWTEAQFGSLLSPRQLQWLHVAWMLTFAFGLIRGCVSIAVLLLRLRSHAPPPKILRDVLDFSLYVVAIIFILRTQLDIDLTSLVATSAIVSVVLGMAMQDTLGNLFAGLSLQLERPYKVGDWVTIKEITGRVVQVGWRATRLETSRRESITLPNNVCSKEAVRNYTRDSRQAVGVDIYFRASHERAPNEVKKAVLEALEHVPLMLREPAPLCRTWGFEESGIRYQVRYFVEDFSQADWVMEEIYTRIWYRFRRDGIEIPFPQRSLNMRNGPPESELPEVTLDEMLRQVDLFSVLRDEERARLRRELVLRRFARGEHVIEQGQEGNTFYLVCSGELSVRVGEVEVSQLTRGQYFGEMSLLTGEPRTATVVALSDVVLLELARPVFARLFADHPELAPKVSALLAQRRNQLDAAMAASGETPPITEEVYILGMLKNIFRLD